MDWLKVWEIVKASPDSKTALVFAGIFIFYVATRLQKWKDGVATKKDLADRQAVLEKGLVDHKKAMYNEKLLLEGTVSSTMESIAKDLKEHKEKDDYRFKIRDEALIPQLKGMDDKVEKSRRSLARIEGALKINVPEVDL